MIEYRPDKFFIAHWFVDQPSAAYRKETGVPNMNWIAAIWRNPDGTLEMKYRFAYFDDKEKFLRSSWYGAKTKPGLTVEQAKAPMDFMAKMTSARNGDARWERVDLNLPGDQAIRVLAKKPWMQVFAYSEEELN
jgi:hypothetical protein